MTTEGADYDLGRDVTRMARARRAAGLRSVVLSLRVSAEEIRRLERMSEETGKSTADLVREAIRSFETPAKPQDVFARADMHVSFRGSGIGLRQGISTTPGTRAISSIEAPFETAVAGT